MIVETLLDPVFPFGWVESQPVQADATFQADAVVNPATISAATNVNPIAITTVEAHGYWTGMWALIYGAVGNTAANGLAQITVTGIYTFTIPVAGNGTWTSGGKVVPASKTTTNVEVGFGFAGGEDAVAELEIDPPPSGGGGGGNTCF